MSERPISAVTATKARTTSAKYSAGCSWTARSAIGSARNVSRTRPIVPAMNDPIAAVARAGFALPRLAISKPSMAVATEPDSPGVLSRMEVVEPPYMPPK